MTSQEWDLDFKPRPRERRVHGLTITIKGWLQLFGSNRVPQVLGWFQSTVYSLDVT
jgi:hypothetical protein